MRLGVIDIGSNTIRLVVWEISENGYYKLIEELKDNVRIGADTLDPSISDEKILGALKTLKKFKVFLESLKVGRTIVVGTEALRRAPNSSEFIKRVKDEIGFDVQILSEFAEGYLDYKGVISSMEVKIPLMVDIGGTSTELVWIKDGEMVESASIPIGTLTLTERFQLQGIVNPKNHTRMEEYLMEEFSKVPWLKEGNFGKLIGVGGSCRTIARIDRHKKRYPMSITHNYTMQDLDVNQMYFTMLTKDAHGRSLIDGLEKDRADIILGALAILSTITKITKIQELRVSGKGLREGILYEHINSNYERSDDMLECSLYSILERHNMDIPHAEHVFKISHKLFRQLKEVHKISDEYFEILKTASLLHDVGMSINFYNHEKHSFYIILNSEINGLNHKEILLSAFCAKYHTRMNTDLTMTAFSSMVNKLDIFIAEKIGLLIAFGECFDRNLMGLVYDVESEITEDYVIIKPHSKEDISTEVNEALKSRDKFLKLFKKDLKIVPKITK